MSLPLAIWLLVLALLLVLGGAGVWLWLRLRRRRIRPEAPAIARGETLPVVLIHGILGFDHLHLLRQRVTYFRGIAEGLRAQGAIVHAARLPPLDAVPDRAQALAQYIESLPYARVNLIAHSMGGLDARYALARCGLSDRVASLVTIATPHWGTPLADLGAAPPLRALRSLVGHVGLTTAAVDWLTTNRAGELNRDLIDVEGVLYGSVVASAQRRSIFTNPVLLSSYLYLYRLAGANDGMVPASSQVWGDVVAEIVADHWAEVGWSRYFDALSFYVQLLEILRQRGL